ncbi:MAG: hypothetical protein OEY38_02620 [Gammaproteobacteria bacterium]|nr:hypothetical protein [Gammaproteobacteria bacterium]
MSTISNVLQSWGTPHYIDNLKAFLSQISIHELPLQQAMNAGFCIDDQLCQFMHIESKRDASQFSIKLGVFFQTWLVGCNCSDDPGTESPSAEFAEIILLIDADFDTYAFVAA